ncbi:MAG: CapA family protein [Bacilli bacterium]|nr:CapA family protein [Bacilli bacterium]
MKVPEKIYLMVIFVSIGIFLLLRIYHILNVDLYITDTYLIDGNIPELREKVSTLRLVMVGDALYHDGVYKDGYNDGKYSFLKQLEMIKPIIQSYDLAYYNQESILGGEEIGLSTYPRFNSPYEVGDAFVDAGFNLVSTANNHTLDRGREAIFHSYQYWSKQSGVLMSGSCDSVTCQKTIPVGEKNGIRYAFLSYTTTTNGINVPKGEEYLVNVYSDERVLEDISKVKDTVDIILVAMHWGSEYHNEPIEEQVRIAHFLASSGVDIVIGNHPHVIEPIEKIGNTYVFYSFGNFISAQTGIDQLVGLMAGLTITKKERGGEKTIEIGNLETNLTYTSYNRQFRDFKVYLFDKIDASILNQKDEVVSKKKKIVESFGVPMVWYT